MIIKRKSIFWNKLTEFIGKPKDQWKASSCDANALKIKNAVELDVNSVLDSFRNYYSTLAENLCKNAPQTN